jgi:exodeoxyribonuclease VII large subunit
MTTRPPASTFGVRILTVSELTVRIREALRADEGLRDLWLEGEVGRVTVSSAGHAYFTLKDQRAQIDCVFFRDERIMSPFDPRVGLRIVAHGRLDLFEPQGRVQFYVESLQPAGFGDLALRFEELKARLSAEGLFDAARKRPLPLRPATIGIATSPTGAVWHDIRNVLARRWPLVRVVLAPCQVQGDAAPRSIVGALQRLARYGGAMRAGGHPELAPGVVILARGGGSLEDLWPFNDETVVRAVVGHPVPVICGVGHEVDVTLADFAADVRAPTPSAAAELAVPDRAAALEDLILLARRLVRGGDAALLGPRQLLAEERRALERLRPDAVLAAERQRAGLLLDRATRVLVARLAGEGERLARTRGRLADLVARSTARRRAALDTLAAGLGALDPFATLERGYAIVRGPDGAILRDATRVRAADPLAIRLARGELEARVERLVGAAPDIGAADLRELDNATEPGPRAS